MQRGGSPIGAAQRVGKRVEVSTSAQLASAKTFLLSGRTLRVSSASHI